MMKGPTKAKNDRKGVYEGNGINHQKNFCSVNIKKVPEAYESLKPALNKCFLSLLCVVKFEGNTVNLS
jgi:hypothetical protein